MSVYPPDREGYTIGSKGAVHQVWPLWGKIVSMCQLGKFPRKHLSRPVRDWHGGEGGSLCGGNLHSVQHFVVVWAST